MRALATPQIFVSPKPGERPESCQDVGWLTTRVDGQGTCGFVVADGATGGWDGQLWAELVVDAVSQIIGSLEHEPEARWVETDLVAALDRARDRWDELHQDLEASDDPITALAHAKFLSSGGYCTLTAGLLGPIDGPDLSLRAIAVGDSPIFHLRREGVSYRLVAAAPLSESDAFDSSPAIVSSRRATAGEGVSGLTSVVFTPVEPGDVILIVTDAIAEWALRRHEDSAPVWSVLSTMDDRGFDQLLSMIRSAREIVADDVLVARFVVEAEHG